MKFNFNPFRKAVRSLFSRPDTRIRRSPSTRKLGCESLEDRMVPAWIAHIGTATGEIHRLGEAMDSDGSTLVSGYFSGSVDFDPSAGVDVRTAPSGSTSTFVAKYGPLGEFNWVRQLAIIGSTQVTLDAAGNPYLFGGYSGTGDFGSGAVYTASGPGTDPFIMRIDRDTGATVWARTPQMTAFTSEQNESVISMSIGADGCVYATGRFLATADFDRLNTYSDNRDQLTATGGSRGGRDAFIWKLDSNGAFRSAWNVGGSSNEEGVSIDVDVDASGSGALYLTGVFDGTTDLNPGPATFSRTSAGFYDVFFARYDITSSNLNLRWGASVGGANYEQGFSSEVSGQYIYLAGEFYDTADFDPGSGRLDLTAASSNYTDTVVAKYRTSDGGLEWARSVGGVGSDFASYAPVIDPVTGAVYVGGTFSEVVDFDPTGSHVNNRDKLYARGLTDGYVLKLDGATGGYQNAWRLGGTDNDSARVYAVSQTLAGPRVHAAGNFYSTSVDIPTGNVLANAGGLRETVIMALDELVPPTTPPVVYVQSASILEGNSGRISMVFTICLSWASDQPVTVRYQTANGTATAGSDYDATSGTLTFAPGELTKTITVSIIGDTTNESDESFALDLFDTFDNKIDSATGTIRNDDSRKRK